ncbi:MAG: hypothetical protein ACLTKE_08710 [Coprococcus sp.]
MKSRKTMGEVIKAVLLVLAIACLYVEYSNQQNTAGMRSYEDMGVHRFSLYRALPTQVKNTANRSARTASSYKNCLVSLL